MKITCLSLIFPSWSKPVWTFSLKHWRKTVVVLYPPLLRNEVSISTHTAGSFLKLWLLIWHISNTHVPCVVNRGGRSVNLAQWQRSFHANTRPKIQYSPPNNFSKFSFLKIRGIFIMRVVLMATQWSNMWIFYLHLTLCLDQ